MSDPVNYPSQPPVSTPPDEGQQTVVFADSHLTSGEHSESPSQSDSMDPRQLVQQTMGKDFGEESNLSAPLTHSAFPELGEKLDELVQRGRLKSSDAELILKRLEKGLITVDQVQDLLGIVDKIADAQWVSDRLADGGIALLLQAPGKKEYEAWLKGRFRIRGVGVVMSPPSDTAKLNLDPQCRVTRKSLDTDALSAGDVSAQAPTGIIPEVDETHDEREIEAALTDLASKSRKKKEGDESLDRQIEERRQEIRKVAQEIEASPLVHEDVLRPVQVDFLADIPGVEVSWFDYRQRVERAIREAEERNTNKVSRAEEHTYG